MGTRKLLPAKKMAAGMLLLLNLAVAYGMPLDLDYMRHIESFIQLPGNDHPELAQAIQDLAAKQQAAKADQDKRMQDEAAKIQKIQDDSAKNQADLKTQIDAFQQKLQEAEKKVADAEAKIA